MNGFAAITFFVFVSVFMSGCFGQPRMRMGSLPTSSFIEPDRLGSHSYGPLGFLAEGDGIVYTCKAGHIDIAHARWNADYTKYLTNKISKAILEDKEKISFTITMEQSEHIVTFSYPQSWIDMPYEKKQIATDEIAFNLGPYITFLATTWHEIATAYGTHYVGIEPEENSAFSWEDSFSNLLGCHIGAEAMSDTEHSFNEAVTILLDERLEELGAVIKNRASCATRQKKSDWFEGNIAVKIKMKNFDIGLDGSVTPTVINGVTGCTRGRVKYNTFSKGILNKYGIKISYQIKPNILEAVHIYKAAGHNEICPERDYPAIIADLKRRATEKGWKWDE